MIWPTMLDVWLYDSQGEYRTDGIFAVVTPMLRQIENLMMMGWLVGPFLLFMGIARLVVIYARSSVRFPVISTRPFMASTMAVGLLANAVVLVTAFPFFSIATGAVIRPMGWFAFVLIWSLSAFLIGGMSGLYAITAERPRALCSFALICTATPFPLAIALIILAAEINGFKLD
ncbi:hypothetical protein CKA38_01390 [Ereboglobus luteus]|uniref:Yip1 domain-containing protein n=2 Tax=Ereboglobus luteus TaxID=1796921 RepID=A0A2U8DZY8_9BACT|nr:hypothetical protein CKA38_01390 [Ereboglobus luteus]